MAQLSALVKSSIFVLAISNFGIVHFKRSILQLCKNRFGFVCTLKVTKDKIFVTHILTHVHLLIQKLNVFQKSLFMNISSNVATIRRTSCIRFKVAPYSFSARGMGTKLAKCAREERDSPSQMTYANQPPRRNFPKSDRGIFMDFTFSKPVEHIAVKL